MKYLKFEIKCPFCGTPIDDIRLPTGVVGSGRTICRECKQIINYQYSESRNLLFVDNLSTQEEAGKRRHVQYSPSEKVEWDGRTIRYILEIEANSLEDVRQQIQSQISDGLYLLSEAIIEDGSPKAVMSVGETLEKAFETAQSEVPVNAEIMEKKILAEAEKQVVFVEATNEQNAVLATKKLLNVPSVVSSPRLIAKTKKGFFSLKPINRYEVETLRLASVKITYRKKAKISAKIGEIFDEVSPEKVERLTLYSYQEDGWKYKSQQVLDELGDKAVDILLLLLWEDKFIFDEAEKSIREQRSKSYYHRGFWKSKCDVMLNRHIHIIDALGEINHPRAVDALIEIVLDPRIHIPKTLSFVWEGFATSPESSTVLAAIQAISNYKEERVFEALLSARSPKLPDYSTTIHALDDALTRLARAGVIDAACEILQNDKDRSRKKYVADILKPVLLDKPLQSDQLTISRIEKVLQEYKDDN